MISTYKHGKSVWYDLENPTPDEVKKLAEKYGIDPIIANELLAPSVRARVDYSTDYVYVILHFPSNNWSNNSNISDLSEIDFIVGKNFIITTRYNNVDALHEFSKTLEVHSAIQNKRFAEHAGFLFFYMVQTLYQSLLRQLEHAKDLMSEIEKNIFLGEEKLMVKELSKINRLLLRFKETTDEHQEIWEAFEIISHKFFEKDFSFYIRGISSEYKKVSHALSSRRDYLSELRMTNDSLLTTKQNETMKTLTTVNFIFLPLALMASIFGMNTLNTPLVGHPYDFEIIVSSMAVIVLFFLVYFKYKKML